MSLLGIAPYLALVFYLFLAYGIFIEPWLLKVTQHKIVLHNLPAAYQGLKIALLCDLHAGGWSNRHLYEKIARLTEQQHPDLILIGGDTVVNHAPKTWATMLEPLSRLTAPCGKFAVLGGHDRIYSASEVQEQVTKLGFTFLNNQALPLPTPLGTAPPAQALWLVGLKDNSHFPSQADCRLALQEVPEEAATITLVHSPDILLDPTCPKGLIVCGHTHGGQVCLPGIGAILRATTVPRKYDAGLISLPFGQIFVSRGAGSTVKLRFYCRPELNLLTLSRHE